MHRPDRLSRVVEMLEREGAVDDVEAPWWERIGLAAQVGDAELVEPLEWLIRFMEIHTGEPADPRPERRQHAPATARGVEAGGVCGGDRLVEPLSDDLAGGGAPVQPPSQPIGAAAWSPAAIHHAVAVAASAIPWDSSHLSASMAALHPSAAAVTAWRYR